MKDTIVIHCLSTKPDWMKGRAVSAKVAEVKRWHVQERGWRDIGYAEIGDRDGTSAGGRDIDKDGDFFEETGAHTKGLNKRSIGIALVGGHGSNKNDQFEKNFTQAQRVWLWDAIDRIEAYTGRKMKIIGHNEVANKACPGFNVQDFIAEGRPIEPDQGFFAAIIKLLAKLFGGSK